MRARGSSRSPGSLLATLATLASIALAAAVAASASAAGAPRVVPGTSAAYLYFPAPSDSRSKLSVSKLGTFRNYTVTYRGADDVSTVLCTESESECQVSLPSGTVTLAVEGYFGVNNTAKMLAAQWGGECAAGAAASCQMAITAGDNQYVRITAGCDGSASSLVQMGSAEGLCIGMLQSEYLVAAHKNTATGRKPKSVKGTWSNTDASDGRNNMTALLNGMNSAQDKSSAHYCNTLSVGGTSGWYLPALNELKAAATPAAPALYGTFYASNTTSAKKNAILTYTSTGQSNSTTSYSTSSDYGTLCFHRITPKL